MSVIGVAEFIVKPNLTGFSKNIDKEVNRSVKSINNKLKAMFTGVGLHFATQFGKSAVTLSSDVDELKNVIDSTFGDGAKRIYEFGETANESFGLVNKQVYELTGRLGSMFKSLGVEDTGILSMLSTELTKLAGDIASFNNLEPEAVMDKFMSGLAGTSLEPMRGDLGVDLSEVTMQLHATEIGVKKLVKNMSYLEKVMLRADLIMTSSAYKMGDFYRTQASWANQTRQLANDITLFKIALGDLIKAVLLPILPLIRGIVQGMTTMMQTIARLLNMTNIVKEKAVDVNSLYDYDQSTIVNLINSNTLVCDSFDEASKKAKSFSDNLTSLDKIANISKSNGTDLAGALNGAFNGLNTPPLELNGKDLDKQAKSLAQMVVDSFNKAIDNTFGKNPNVMTANIKKSFATLVDSMGNLTKSIQDKLAEADVSGFSERIKSDLQQVFLDLNSIGFKVGADFIDGLSNAIRGIDLSKLALMTGLLKDLTTYLDNVSFAQFMQDWSEGFNTDNFTLFFQTFNELWWKFIDDFFKGSDILNHPIFEPLENLLKELGDTIAGIGNRIATFIASDSGQQFAEIFIRLASSIANIKLDILESMVDLGLDLLEAFLPVLGLISELAEWLSEDGKLQGAIKSLIAMSLILKLTGISKALGGMFSVGKLLFSLKGASWFTGLATAIGGASGGNLAKGILSVGGAFKDMALNGITNVKLLATTLQTDLALNTYIPVLKSQIKILGECFKDAGILVFNGVKGALLTGWTTVTTWFSGTVLPAIGVALSKVGAVLIAGWPVILGALVVALVAFFYNTNDEFKAWMDGIAKGVQEGFIWVMKKLGEFFADMLLTVGTKVKAVIDFFRTLGTEVGNIFVTLWNGVKKDIEIFIETAKGIFDGLKLFFSGDFSGGLAKIWDSICGGIEKSFKNSVDVIKGVWQGLINIIKSGFNSFFVTPINNTIRKLNKGISFPDWDWLPDGMQGKNFGFNIPEIPRLAKGGVVNSSILANIGEAGKEAVIPLENNTEWMKTFIDLCTKSMIGAMQVVFSNNNQVVEIVLDGKVLAKGVIPYINKTSKKLGGVIA